MIRFENKEKFREWLEQNLKADCFDFDVFLDDLDYKYSETASLDYELKSYETKTGQAACYSFEVKDLFYLDGEVVEEGEDYDDFERIFIF